MTISPPDALRALLSAPSPCFVAVVEPDGGPQLTRTRVDTDIDIAIAIDKIVQQPW